MATTISVVSWKNYEISMYSYNDVITTAFTAKDISLSIVQNWVRKARTGSTWEWVHGCN